MNSEVNRKLKVCMGVVLLIAMVILSARLALYEKENAVPVSSGVAEIASSLQKKTIVIDAGHGGNDPGKVGINNAYEKDINLQIAKKVKRYLEANDINVIMIREEDKGLYEEGASNKKVQDMKARVALIDSSDASLAISIHQNSFPQESVSGTQVFYYQKNEESKVMAEMLQATVTELLKPEKEREAKANKDYYLLKKAKANVLIVECGFLSNKKEADLLIKDTYQERMAWAIAVGTMRCLSEME